MSAQRTVSSAGAPAARYALAFVVVAALAAWYFGWRMGVTRDVLVAAAANAGRVALVREQPCYRSRCETLWIGASSKDAERVATLPAGDHATEIAWAADGYRVGFVINGYQLRIFDGMNGGFVSQVNLLDSNATPSDRIVRGVTFSSNGAAVTFDECPRYSSGCKSGLKAVR